jgi:hypothetical protein
LYRLTPPFLRIFARWLFPALCPDVVSAAIGGYIALLSRAIGVLWRATADEDGHYSFAVAL